MSNTSIETPNTDLTLTLENSPKTLPGFVHAGDRFEHHGQFAKTLASAFIKFTAEGQYHSAQDSVDSFIALADLHRELTDEIRAFMHAEVPFVYEDQQIQPLLLNFAVYRLTQISRRYYFATLQNQPQTILEDLKTVIRSRQQEYDLLLHHV